MRPSGALSCCDEAVEFVALCAAGIWSLQEVVFPYARRRLDEFHLKEKIYERSEQAYTDKHAKQKHREVLLAEVEQGRVQEAVSYLKKHLPRDEYRKEAATKLINYLERHEERIPNYCEVKTEGGTVSSGALPNNSILRLYIEQAQFADHSILGLGSNCWARPSSGLIEKGNDLIVARRMKEGVMHWTREGAEPIIQQRTTFINRYARARTGPYEVAFCHALAQ